MKKNNKYFKYIDQIQLIRQKNNVNWMDILRLAFKYAPKEASQIMNKINNRIYIQMHKNYNI